MARSSHGLSTVLRSTTKEHYRPTAGRSRLFRRGAGQADIWMLDLATMETRSLLTAPSGEFRPRWSPDGEWLAFSSDREPLRSSCTGATVPGRAGPVHHAAVHGSFRRASKRDGAPPGDRGDGSRRERRVVTGRRAPRLSHSGARGSVHRRPDVRDGHQPNRRHRRDDWRAIAAYRWCGAQNLSGRARLEHDGVRHADRPSLYRARSGAHG